MAAEAISINIQWNYSTTSKVFALLASDWGLIPEHSMIPKYKLRDP